VHDEELEHVALFIGESEEHRVQAGAHGVDEAGWNVDMEVKNLGPTIKDLRLLHRQVIQAHTRVMADVPTIDHDDVAELPHKCGRELATGQVVLIYPHDGSVHVVVMEIIAAHVVIAQILLHDRAEVHR
jgi:hypothetical protein